MLVLSRQRDETIIIGDDIEITVVDIRGDKVRLGVTAPKSISVLTSPVTLRAPSHPASEGVRIFVRCRVSPLGTSLREPVVVSSMMSLASMPSSFQSAAAERCEMAASGPAQREAAISFCSHDEGTPRIR